MHFCLATERQLWYFD